MKPFLLLSSRASDEASAGEAEAIRRLMGLDDAGLVQRRIEREPLGVVDLDEYSGVLVGGSDFSVSEAYKPDNQVRAEAELGGLLDEILARDFPFFGLCYGVGVLTDHLGGRVSGKYAEAVGAIPVTLTDAGRADPLLDGVPEEFYAFVGHKEAAEALPDEALVLATGAVCPVQLFRLGRNVYASQFHPELDAAGLIARMHIYVNFGYFRPDEFDELAEAAQAAPADGSQHRLLANFARMFARE